MTPRRRQRAGRALARLRGALVAALAVVVVAVPGLAQAAADRVALMIGNGRYAHVPDLVNPPNDAADLGALFTELGFEVTRVGDADYDGLRRALDAFRDRAAEAEVAVIYFAGHGIEVDRINHLLPVDAQLRTLADVTFQAIPLDMVRAAAYPARRLSLVIVDACRNNPFQAQLQGETRALTRGLAVVRPHGQNNLVAFAAKEGTVAADGTGRNSPYAEALLAELREPGVEIGKLFRRVRDRTLALTGGVQEPALYGSLSAADFYFLPPDTPAAPVVTERALDLEFWRTVKDSADPRDFEDYLAAFPEGVFAVLARRRLAETRATEAAPELASLGPETEIAGEPDPAGEAEPQVAALDPARPAAPETRAEAGRPDAAQDERVAALPAPAAPVADEFPLPALDTAPREPEAAPTEADGSAAPPPARVARATDAAAEVEDGTSGPAAAPVSLDRSEVRDLQARLNLLGHDAGPEDGLMGRRTRSAIDRFARAEGLPAAGVATVELLDRLAQQVPERRLAALRAERRAAREAAARAEAERRAAAARAAAAAEERKAARPDPVPDPTADAPRQAAVTAREAAPEPQVTPEPDRTADAAPTAPQASGDERDDGWTPPGAASAFQRGGK